MKLRRTKIVVTLGPATDTRSVLTEVLETADAVRLNMSHGCLDDHAKRIKMVREIAQAGKRDIGIFADLQGPKIRIGRFATEDGVNLIAGARSKSKIDL